MSVRKLKTLLSNPDKWTKNTLFRDKYGNPIPTNVPAAKLNDSKDDFIPVCGWDAYLKIIKTMSLYGAIYLAFPREDSRSRIMNKIRRLIPHKFVAQFNDDQDTTFEDIQKVLNKLSENDN